jgi:hypothetical protein
MGKTNAIAVMVAAPGGIFEPCSKFFGGEYRGIREGPGRGLSSPRWLAQRSRLRQS